MGGAVKEGNVTKHAEYNIYCDPEAAHIVFHLDIQMVLMPLDLTH
jgi:inosine-uridine nucleoside N-ribohydrolase